MGRKGKRNDFKRMPHVEVGMKETSGSTWCSGNQVSQVFWEGRGHQLGQMLQRGGRWRLKVDLSGSIHVTGDFVERDLRGVMVILCCAQSLSHVPLFVTPWTVAHQAPLSLGILQRRILEWFAMPSSRGIFPTQELNQGLLHCRWILHQLSYQGSPVMVIDPLKLERIEESVRWARSSEYKHSFENFCQGGKRGCIQKRRLGEQRVF